MTAKRVRIARDSTTQERLDFRSKPDPETGCVLWTGSTDRRGYGFIRHNGRVRRAPRVSWENANGRPVPDGLQVLHNCPAGDNPRCINPAHLWLGTIAQNREDKIAKGRQAKGETGNAKITEVQALAIQADRRSTAAIAGEYGLSVDHVRSIKSGRRWKHLLEGPVQLTDRKEGGNG